MKIPVAISVESLRPDVIRLAHRIVASLHLAYRIFLRDIRTFYSTMLFGLAWEFIEPIVFALIFIYLHRFRAITIPGLTIPYALFVVSGLLVWQSFSETLTMALNSIRRMGGLLDNLQVSPEALILSVGFRVVFNSFFRCVVIVGVTVAFGAATPGNILLFLAAFPAVLLAGASIGFLLAPFSVVSGDIATAVSVILRPWMFLSSAIFPLPAVGLLSHFSTFNPAAVLIENLRALLTTGELANASLFFAVVAGFVPLSLLAWYVYRVCLRIVSWQA